jgi:dihydrofolate synthase/folylpolyglutamate synthase
MLPNDLKDWLNLLEATHGLRIELGLTNIQQAAKALDLLSLNAPVIIVGGTNGKGSTVRALETIYHTAGYRTASYTSPHLFVFNERIKLNTHNIDDKTLCQAFAAVFETAKIYKLSYFEVVTLAAFWIFKHTPLDIIILEVGLGGRLDAVNIIDPDLSIITSIDLDHTDKLGDTRELIAKEKAGIFRKNIPVICGDPNPPAALREIAEQLGAPFVQISRPAGTPFFKGGSLLDENMNIAATAVMQLQNLLLVSEENIIQGLKNTHLPGRQQIVYKKCKHIFDVAHNPAGLKKLVQRILLENTTGRVLLVTGMLATKDLRASFAEIKDVIDLWYVAPIQHHNAASVQQLESALNSLQINHIDYFSNLNAAYQEAFDAATENDLLIIAGSFHTVCEIFLDNFMVKQAPPVDGLPADKLP